MNPIRLLAVPLKARPRLFVLSCGGKMALGLSKAVLVLMVLLLPVGAHAQKTVPGGSSVITYQPTPDAEQSKMYSVTVNGRDAFVERSGAKSGDMQRHAIHYTRFACSRAPVDIVVSVNEDVTSCNVSPRRYGIIPKISGNTVSFTIPGYYYHLYIEINDIEEKFVLLTDPPETDRPNLSDPDVTNVMDFGVDNTGRTVDTVNIQGAIDTVLTDPGKNILYFPRGIYRTGHLDINGNMKVYLEDGSIIRGSTEWSDYPRPRQYCKEPLLILVRNASEFQLYGRGTIDGEGAAIYDQYARNNSSWLIDLFETINCRNVVIKDVVLRNPCNWGCFLCYTDDSSITNLKMLSIPHHICMDGIDISDAQNIAVKNCFSYAYDDAFTTMTLSHEYTREVPRRRTENILFEDCVGWTLCSGVRIAWNSHVMLNDIRFRNVDWLFAEMQCIAIHGLFEDCAFRDVHV